MPLRLVALHGYTLNGSIMREQLSWLTARLERQVEVSTPEGAVTCSPESVDRLYAAMKGDRQPAPHHSWWNASDDGREYHGWDDSLERIAATLDNAGPVGVLGFSQGAMAAAIVAALSARGTLPKLAFTIHVAGRVPRATSLEHLFQAPIQVPSLHVWGTRDPFAGTPSQQLAERFAIETRAVEIWPGPHALPRKGPAADAIASFVSRYLD